MISVSVWKPSRLMPTPRPSSGPASQPGQPPLRAGNVLRRSRSRRRRRRGGRSWTRRAGRARRARAARASQPATAVRSLGARLGLAADSWLSGRAGELSGGGRLHALIVTSTQTCKASACRVPCKLPPRPPGAFRQCECVPMRAARRLAGRDPLDLCDTSLPQTHTSRSDSRPPAPCPDPVRRRRRGSCRRRAGARRPDRGLARAGRGHDHRRPRRDGTGAASRGRGRLSRAAALHAVDVHARLLAARARRADPLVGAPAAVAARLAPAGTVHRRARPRRDRVHLSGGDGRAGAVAPHQSGRLPHGGDDHRPDGPVLLGAARDRHAPGDVRRVDVRRSSASPGRAACAWCVR